MDSTKLADAEVNTVHRWQKIIKLVGRANIHIFMLADRIKKFQKELTSKDFTGLSVKSIHCEKTHVSMNTCQI